MKTVYVVEAYFKIEVECDCEEGEGHSISCDYEDKKMREAENHLTDHGSVKIEDFYLV